MVQCIKVHKNIETRSPMLQCSTFIQAAALVCRRCGNKCKTWHLSKSLVTVSPALKRCRLSSRHFHASRFYDHIHSHGLSTHQTTQYEFCFLFCLAPLCPQMWLPQVAPSSFHYQPGHLSARQIVW